VNYGVGAGVVHSWCEGEPGAHQGPEGEEPRAPGFDGAVAFLKNGFRGFARARRWSASSSGTTRVHVREYLGTEIRASRALVVTRRLKEGEDKLPRKDDAKDAARSAGCWGRSSSCRVPRMSPRWPRWRADVAPKTSAPDPLRGRARLHRAHLTSLTLVLQPAAGRRSRT